MYTNQRLISDRLSHAIATVKEVVKKRESLKNRLTYLELKIEVLLDEACRIKSELDSVSATAPADRRF